MTAGVEFWRPITQPVKSAQLSTALGFVPLGFRRQGSPVSALRSGRTKAGPYQHPPRHPPLTCSALSAPHEPPRPVPPTSFWPFTLPWKNRGDDQPPAHKGCGKDQRGLQCPPSARRAAPASSRQSLKGAGALRSSERSKTGRGERRRAETAVKR